MAVAENYVKMLNMGLPRGAVEQKMRAEGVDPSLLFAGRASTKRMSRRPQSVAKSVRIYGAPPKVPLRAWYWQPIRDEATPKYPLWAAANSVVETLVLDTSSLETAFAKGQEIKTTTEKPVQKKKDQSFVDNRTQQNCGIVLKKLKLPAREIAAAVYRGDAGEMSLAKVEILSKAKPTDEILNAALERDDLDDKSDDTDADNLVEIFFRAVSLVPRYVDRLDALLLSHTFESLVLDLDFALTSVHRACDEVSDNANKDLGIALAACLKIGNALNTGTTRGDARAFGLGSLARLATTKANDGETTLAHSVAVVIAKKDSTTFDRLYALKSDVLDPAANANIPGTWDSDASDMDRRLICLESLLEDDLKEEDEGLPHHQPQQPQQSRLAHLLTTIVEDNDDEDDASDGKKNSISSVLRPSEDDDDDPHYERRAFRSSMASFALDSRKKLDDLKARRKALDAKLQACTAAIGEPTASPKDLFDDYIGAFIRAIYKAHQANEERRVEQARRRRPSPPTARRGSEGGGGDNLFDAFSAVQAHEDMVLSEFHKRQARRESIAPTLDDDDDDGYDSS